MAEDLYAFHVPVFQKVPRPSFPGLQALREFLVAKPDRHVAEGLLTELHAKKVDIYLHQQGLDTSTLSGRAMFQMMGVFAEFERALIRERVLAGLARARQAAYIGRFVWKIKYNLEAWRRSL